MNKFKYSPLLLAFALILISTLFSGCTNTDKGTTSGQDIVITDDIGHNTTISSDIHRVVSLSPSETEIFYTLSPQDKGISLVGRTDYDTYPPEVMNVTSVGGPQTLSVEAIAGLDPDLILTTTVADKTVIDQLRDLEYPVLIFNPESFDGIYHNIYEIGKALGQDQQAATLINSLQAGVDEVINSKPAEPPKKVMFVVTVQPFYVAGNNTFPNEFITTSGGVNIFGDQSGYFVASDEQIVNRSPDVIIVPSTVTDKGFFKDQLLQMKELKSVPAIANERICIIDEDIISRPGPRFVEGLKEVDTCING